MNQEFITSEPISAATAEDVEPDEDVYDLEEVPPEEDIDRFEIDVREDPFSINELTRRIREGRLILDPEFQRNFVWRSDKQSQFIESILLNIPLPPLFINQNTKGQYIIIDGRQRTTTVYRFLTNEFALEGLRELHWLNGMRLQDLSEEIRARIEDQKMNCWILKPGVPMYTCTHVHSV